MEKGLLIFDKGYSKLYLPIFCEDRELVFSVLTDAMIKYTDSESESERLDHIGFYEIANAMGKERMGRSSPLIGIECIIGLWFDSVEEAYENAGYIFEPDFTDRRVKILK